MTNYREILRLAHQGISQRNIAMSCGCSRNTVAKTLLRAQEAEIRWPLPEDLEDAALEAKLRKERQPTGGRKKPDYEHVHKEMAKSNVTLSLLWNEYCENCRREGSIPLMYSQFCYHYQQFALCTKATMHIQHKPGERMEVDWAGQTAFLQNNITGAAIPVYIFVAVLPCSGYAYLEGFLSQKQECWIEAHLSAYAFFGGVTRIVVPDNLKTGVQKADRQSPIINQVYRELAEHYGTAVIPARVRKPKDKPSVEGAVGNLSTWVVAALRNRQFFSLQELNEAMADKLEQYNHKPFQKKPGSRHSAFLEEQAYLMPLPAQPFQMALWRVATVQFNYHVTVEKMHYSVPYEYIKQKMDVRLTKDTVEIFFGNSRIASHVRLQGYPGQYSTSQGHMPKQHQAYQQWDGQHFLSWAISLGEHTHGVMQSILAAHKIEQLSYRSCLALMKLADTYSVPRLETACKRALSYSPRPSLKSVQTILKTCSDKRMEQEKQDDASASHGFTRGASYYGRDGQC